MNFWFYVNQIFKQHITPPIIIDRSIIAQKGEHMDKKEERILEIMDEFDCGIDVAESMFLSE